MKDFFKINVGHMAIIAAVIFFSQFNGCADYNGYSAHSDTVRTETVFRYDTVIHTIEQHKTTYVIEHADTHAARMQDTSQTVADYFTPKQYTDSLSDSILTGAYTATIFKNEIFDPKFSYQITRPQTITNNTILSPQKNKVYLGGFAAVSGTSPSVGGMISLENKRGQIASIGVGTNKTYFIGYQWKIRLKK